MNQNITYQRAFEILISQRGWYKKSGILASNASKDKKLFKCGELSEQKIVKYLIADGWLKREDGMFFKSNIILESEDEPISEPLTQLMQPTLLTNSRHQSKLIHYRLLCTMISTLQPQMRINLANKKNKIQQLPNKDKVVIEIPYKDFGLTTDRYNELRQALRALAGTTIEFDTDDNWVITGLCKAMIPKDKYARSIKLEFDPDVADAITSVHNGFTQFSKEIVFKLNSVYSIQLYLLCCSWRDKSGFKRTIEWLRKWLYIENKYTSYKDFSSKILKAAQEELKLKADVWFEFSPIVKVGEKDPYMISFKVIHNNTPAEIKALDNQKSIIIRWWTDNLKLSAKTIEELLTKLNDNNIKEIYIKTFNILVKIEDNSNIIDISSYAYTSLIKAFDEK